MQVKFVGIGNTTVHKIYTGKTMNMISIMPADEEDYIVLKI